MTKDEYLKIVTKRAGDGESLVNLFKEGNFHSRIVLHVKEERE